MFMVTINNSILYNYNTNKNNLRPKKKKCQYVKSKKSKIIKQYLINFIDMRYRALNNNLG